MPYKQMIERLNRTYKASYRPTYGFDICGFANYELVLWVAYKYRFYCHENCIHLLLDNYS